MLLEEDIKLLQLLEVVSEGSEEDTRLRQLFNFQALELQLQRSEEDSEDLEDLEEDTKLPQLSEELKEEPKEDSLLKELKEDTNPDQLKEDSPHNNNNNNNKLQLNKEDTNLDQLKEDSPLKPQSNKEVTKPQLLKEPKEPDTKLKPQFNKSNNKFNNNPLDTNLQLQLVEPLQSPKEDTNLRQLQLLPLKSLLHLKDTRLQPLLLNNQLK